MEEIDLLLDMAQYGMERALKHTQIELSKIRAGKANSNMLDGIMIDYYGAMTPITQVSSITTPDARSIQLKPFERKIINIQSDQNGNFNKNFFIKDNELGIKDGIFQIEIDDKPVGLSDYPGDEGRERTDDDDGGQHS